MLFRFFYNRLSQYEDYCSNITLSFHTVFINLINYVYNLFPPPFIISVMIPFFTGLLLFFNYLMFTIFCGWIWFCTSSSSWFPFNNSWKYSDHLTSFLSIPPNSFPFVFPGNIVLLVYLEFSISSLKFEIFLF